MTLRRVLADLDWVTVILAGALALCGLVFIDSATADDLSGRSMAGKQGFVLVLGLVVGAVTVSTHYGRVMRAAWLLYAVTVIALALLPWFGVIVNGAQRWYKLPGGFLLQPAEFAKLGLILALASYLRFRHKAQTWDGLVVPIGITLVPATLILKQPDLGSSLVLWPVLLAMCFVAGAPPRAIVRVALLGLVVGVAGYFVMHGYQRERIDTWREHFAWQPEAPVADSTKDAAEEMRTRLRTTAYQPWQALIAIGSGGWSGFGIGRGPQNIHDFLPYRESDYVFAVVAEETGLLGCLGVLGLQMLLALRLLWIAARSRERFGRLLAVGVATYLSAQSLMHAAVCAWLVPATGLPMPLVSYGGSSTLVALLAIALVLSVSARREPVLSADGFA